MKEIPLRGGSVNAHQVVTAQLGDNLLEFELDYLQSGKWNVNISREDVRLVTGATLTSGCDIIQHWQLDDIGKLVFTGDDTTLDNLGVDNRLIWVEPDV